MTTLFNLLSPVQKKLLQLLQNSLWAKPIDSDDFEKTAASEWKEIMELASVQGVFALAFDGIAGLAKDVHPPKDLLIQWGLGVKKIEARYLAQKKALQSLAALYKTQDLRCLILKGVGISRLYPIPEHRESGDLDIYLFGNFNKGNFLMEEMGIKVDYGCSVHSKFEFQNIPVENHLSFMPLDWQEADRDFEKILHRLLSEEPPTYSEDHGVYFPLTSFNLLYLYKHAIKHFIASGIVLRHLCDLAFLINLCRKREEYASFYETMKSFNLNRYVDSFNFIIEEILGLKLKGEMLIHKDPTFAKKIVNDILKQKKLYPILPRTTILQLVKAKLYGTLILLQNRWKYEAVNKRMFPKELTLRMNFGIRSFSDLNSKQLQ